MTQSEAFLAALLIIYIAPWAVWRIGRLERVAPLVVVQIVGGVLLGPGVFGALAPAAYQTVFTPGVIGMLGALATWAVMLFVWTAGLELDLGDAWVHRRDAGITAACALAAPFALGALAAALLLQSPGWVGERGSAAQAIVGIAMASAVTAIPILVIFLDQLGIRGAPLGQRVLRYASLDDIAIWAVLAIVIVDLERIALQVAFIPAFALAAFAARRTFPRLPQSDRLWLGIAWMAACAWVADWAGYHVMVGAFVAGAALDLRWFGKDEIDRFQKFVLVALMPVFFLSTGIRTSWTLGSSGVLVGAFVLLVAAVMGKHLGVHLAARLMRWEPGEARLVGWLLQTKALILIIFVQVLLERQIISSNAFTALVLMAVASTTLTAPMARRALQRIGGGARLHGDVSDTPTRENQR